MLEQLRKDVWKCNLELIKYKLVVMTSGNVSGRDPETGYVVIKPSGYVYENLTPEDMVIVDLAGNIIEGHLKPSTDTETHLCVYKQRPDICGMVHTHSTYASTYAVLGEPIPAVLTAIGMLGGEVPLGGFVPIGGAEIGEEIVKKIGNKMAIVMQNHGVFTIGRDAFQATKMAVEVEEIAKITYLASLRGKPIPLSDSSLKRMVALYKEDYGQV